MAVDTLFETILGLIQVLLRVGCFWMFFPVFGATSTPAPIRVAGAFCLSFALQPVVAMHLEPWRLDRLPDTSQLFLFALRELAIGAGMGLVCRWMIGTCVAAAHWVGAQMGFSQGGMFNPEFDTSESAWAELHQWMCLTLFLSVGGHYLLLQALKDSYAMDASRVFANLGDLRSGRLLWIEVGSRFFKWMLQLAAPLTVVLLVLQAALGVLSKFIPQMNIWAVSVPITLGVGVFVFSLLSPLYGDALGSLVLSTHDLARIWLRYLSGGG